MGECIRRTLPVIPGTVEPPVHHPLHPTLQRLEQRRATRVEAETAIEFSFANGARMACRMTIPPTRTPASTAVTIAQPRVRLMSLSISYSRYRDRHADRDRQGGQRREADQPDGCDDDAVSQENEHDRQRKRERKCQRRHGRNGGRHFTWWRTTEDPRR